MIRQIAILITGCICFGFTSPLHSQLPHDQIVTETEECIRQLENATGDSVEYGKKLFSFAQYCRRQGMFEHSVLSAELAMGILEKRLVNHQREGKNALPLRKSLMEIHAFLGDILMGREDFQVEALEHFGLVIDHSIEIMNSSLSQLDKDAELTETLKEEMEDLWRFPDLSDATSWQEWKKGETKAAIETLTDALEDTDMSTLSPAKQQQLKTRLEVIRLAKRGSLKDAVATLEMAEKMVFPTSVSLLLSMQRMPDYFLAFMQAARLYERNHEYLRAVQVYRRIGELLQQTVGKELPYLLPYERSTLWKMVQPFFTGMQVFAFRHGTKLDEAVELLYETNLLKKEIFFIISSRLAEQVALAKDDYLLELQARRDSVTYEEKTFQVHLEGDYMEKLKNDIRIMALEKQMVSYLKSKNSFPVFSGWHHSWQEVASALSEGEAVIEFIALDINEYGEKAYMAVVVRGDGKAPRFVPLKEEEDIEMWTPVEKELAGCRDIYVSPDGNLHSVSFAALHDGKQYLCDKYTFHYVLSTGEVPLIKTAKAENTIDSRDIYFFGGADFGIPIGETSTLRGQGFAYLPGTVKEIRNICDILSPRWNVHKFMGRNATEQTFKQLSYSPLSSAVIHISTHGFNLPYDASVKSLAIQCDGKSGYYEPLLRTGFVLSGANRAWTRGTPPGKKEDGILTAFEIADLNLANVDLVVLSACETGLGEVKDGEGIFGLQRAFRLAGARALLVSLWKVADKETAELMTTFYRLWQEGSPMQEAFARAQHFLREKYPHEPVKWAGFILVE